MTYPEALHRLQLGADYLYASADEHGAADADADEAPKRIIDSWNEAEVDALTARNLSEILA